MTSDDSDRIPDDPSDDAVAAAGQAADDHAVPAAGEADDDETANAARAQLSAEALRRLQAARLWVAAKRPYYAKAVFASEIIATAAPRVGIDERWRIYANSDFLESVSVKRAAVELIHAINHVLRDHAQRARNASVDATALMVWAAAADCEINDDLAEDDLIDNDDDWVLPYDFGLDDMRTAEHYYGDLLGRAHRVTVSLGCGSGCHSQPLPHELAVVEVTRAEEAGGLSDFDRKLLQRSTAAEIAQHQAEHGLGSVPEGLARWAEAMQTPKVDWRQQLAAAVRLAAHHKAGAMDYTWQRISRRQQPQDAVLRPGMTRPVPSVTVVVDTSASMSQSEVDSAVAEIGAIIATIVPGDSVRVLSVDAAVHTDQRIYRASQITLKGGGGTDMAAGIRVAAETSPDAIVVITDGWTPWPQTPPRGARSVIAALTAECRHYDVPDWIQTIEMSDDLAA